MKKILHIYYLTIIFMAFAIINVKAESLQFISKEEIVAGDINDELTTRAEIQNTTFSELEVKMKFSVDSLTPGHEVIFCWDYCYAPMAVDFETDAGVILKSMQSSGNQFHANLVANDISGISKFKFTFFVKDKPDDFISYVVKFVVGAQSATSEIIDITNKYISVSPNPANENTLIKINNPGSYDNTKLTIFSPEGKIIKSIPITNNSDLSLETSDMAAGMYFVSLDINGNRKATEKLIIYR